jgi:hypothetical protein
VRFAFVQPRSGSSPTARLARSLARALVAAGHDVCAFALETGPAPFPGHPGASGEPRPFAEARAARPEFDAVVAFGPGALLAGFALEASAVVHVVDGDPRSDRRIPDARLFAAACRAPGAARVATSAALAERLDREFGGSTLVAPAFAEPAAPVSRPKPPPGRAPVVLVDAGEDGEAAFASARRLARRLQGVTTWCVVPGASRRAAVDARVRRVDPGPPEARGALLRACDVVVPAADVGLDLVRAEARACGVALAERASPDAVRAALDGAVPGRGGDAAASASADAAAAALLQAVASRRAPTPEEREAAARRLRAPAPARRPEGAPAPRASPRQRPAAPPPSATAPVLFVGQPAYFRSAWEDAVAQGWGAAYAVSLAGDPGLDGLPAALERSGAGICVVFDPWHLADAPRTLAAVRASGVRLVAWSSEPVPTDDGAVVHWDQLRRLDHLRRARDAGWDLWIHYDPSSAAFLRGEGFGPLAFHPLPVSERLFHPEDVGRDLDACFLGWSTPHREAFLAPVEARFRTVHVAHGLFDEDARRLLNRAKVVLNLHAHEYPNFENRCVQALFCGRPVVSEPLSGGWLSEGTDYLVARTPKEMVERVAQVVAGGDAAAPQPRFDRRRFLAASLRDLLASEPSA